MIKLKNILGIIVVIGLILKFALNTSKSNKTTLRYVKMNIKTFLLLISLLIVSVVESQSLTRQSISSIGFSSSEIENVSIKQTIGQPSNTTCLLSEKNIIRQGFQQPAIKINSITSEEFDINLIVFPNPAQNELTIESNNQCNHFLINIYNQYGQKVYFSDFYSELNIDCSSWPGGIYILSLSTNEFYMKSIQIIKSN